MRRIVTVLLTGATLPVRPLAPLTGGIELRRLATKIGQMLSTGILSAPLALIRLRARMPGCR